MTPDERTDALAEGMCARASSPCGECWANAERLLASPALRDLLASERAAALREVADEWQWGAWTILTSPPPAGSVPSIALGQRVTDWLRARADREVQP